jgi:hypothetical protein
MNKKGWKEFVEDAVKEVVGGYWSDEKDINEIADEIIVTIIPLKVDIYESNDGDDWDIEMEVKSIAESYLETNYFNDDFEDDEDDGWDGPTDTLEEWVNDGWN